MKLVPRPTSLAALGAVLMLSICAAAQEGSIDFVVLDPSGAVLSHARVSVIDGTKKLAEGKTNEQGALSLSGVKQGQHRYKIKFRGFQTCNGTVTVLPDQRIRVDATLRLVHGNVKITGLD